MKYRDYVRKEVAALSDIYIAEAMEYNRDGTATLPPYFIGTTADTVKNVLSAAACVVLSVIIVIAFVLMRNSISTPPADTTADTGSAADTETDAETDAETNAETEADTDAETDKSVNYVSSNSEYEYTVKFGEVTLNRYVGNDEDVIIPHSIDGYPVRSLGTYVLEENAWGTISTGMFTGVAVKHITIPGSVTVINDGFVDANHIETIVIREGVQTIENAAFCFCSSLREITIPKSVQYIGEEAFINRNNLRTVYYLGTMDEWTALMDASAYNSGLENVTVVCMPNTPLTLVSEDGLFEYRVDTDGNVTVMKYLGRDADVAVPEEIEGMPVVKIGNSEERNGKKQSVFGSRPITSVTIPSSVTEIGERAFYDCDSLAFVELGGGVTYIGEEAFADCDGLTELTIPSNVKTLGSKAFGGCTALKTVTFENGITAIGEYAFDGCTSLSTVSLPISVTAIGDGAFRGAASLETIVVPAGCVNIGKDAFAGTAWLDGAEDGLVMINDGVYAYKGAIPEDGTVKIGEGVKYIYDAAFSGVGELVGVRLPSSLLSIGGRAFENCRKLETLRVPDGVNTLGEEIVYGCLSLQSLYLPETVTTLGDNVFAHTPKLAEIRFGGTESQWELFLKLNDSVYENYIELDKYTYKWTVYFESK